MLKLLLAFGFELFTLSISSFAQYANYPSGACLKAGLCAIVFAYKFLFKLKNSLGKKLPLRSLSHTKRCIIRFCY
jgi:hypothetical protein